MTFEPSQDLEHLDFAAGALLLVDKPKGYTSFDVVNQIRYRLRKLTGIKRIKVGHSGTLDPMATGLLLIATGKATKTLTELTGLPKAYTGTITFGATTPSYDAETEREGDYPTAHLDEEVLAKAVREHLSGAIEQLPPVYSAIKIDGKRAYKSARAGQEVVMQARSVLVNRFDLTRVALPELDFEVAVSKGTYVRSLAHDLGQLVGSGAYLSALRRTSVGAYSIADALSLTDIIARLEARIQQAH